MSGIDLTVRVRAEHKPHPHLISVRRLLDLARQWDRWADDYDAQARQQRGCPSTVFQLTAWAQAYRNAAALLVLTVQPRPKPNPNRRHGDDEC